MDSWKEKLLRGARLNGMCKNNLSHLKECKSKEEAIELYKMTIDWALERGYPSMSDLLADFSNMEKEGVFIERNFDGELLDQHQVYVFHNCTGSIRVALNYDKAIITMLYFANGCDMTIKCTQKNFHPIRVPLYIFGENIIKAESDDNVKFIKYNESMLYD